MYLYLSVYLFSCVLLYSLGRSLGAAHLGRPTPSMYSDTDYSTTALTLFAIRSYRDCLVSFSLYLPCISRLRPNAYRDTQSRIPFPEATEALLSSPQPILVLPYCLALEHAYTLSAAFLSYELLLSSDTLALHNLG